MENDLGRRWGAGKEGVLKRDGLGMVLGTLRKGRLRDKRAPVAGERGRFRGRFPSYPAEIRVTLLAFGAFRFGKNLSTTIAGLQCPLAPPGVVWARGRPAPPAQPALVGGGAGS